MRWRMPPLRSSTRAPAGAGARCRTPPTSLSSSIARRCPTRSWQRANDYYTEGLLLWLDVDSRLRELSADRRSLDDFCRAFFGAGAGDTAPRLYAFDDVVNGLDAVAANDWRGFLRARLDGHGPDAPLDGLARSCWKLVFMARRHLYRQLRETGEGRAPELTRLASWPPPTMA
jgi:predicted metalloprotease with PDZ domain